MNSRIGQLHVRLEDESAACLKPVFELQVGDARVSLNGALGRGVRLMLDPDKNCLHCGAQVRKLYASGYCYDCFSTLARCDLCVVSPDRCHLHLGTCREPDWGAAFCMQPHVVYLANTSGPKIGITRADRVPHRWLDQGAAEALPVAAVPSRRAAGVIEAHFRTRLNDRTDWRRLVSGDCHHADLPRLATQLRERLADLAAIPAVPHVADELQASHWLDADAPVRIEYPVMRFSPAVRVPLSATSPNYQDNLCGVIGQYLLFTQGVLPLGAYRGQTLHLEFGEPFAAAEVTGMPGDGSDQLPLFD